MTSPTNAASVNTTWPTMDGQKVFKNAVKRMPEVMSGEVSRQFQDAINEVLRTLTETLLIVNASSESMLLG